MSIKVKKKGKIYWEYVNLSNSQERKFIISVLLK